MAGIAEREPEVATITANIVSSSEDSIKTRIGTMRTAAMTMLKDLRELLGGDDEKIARAQLLKHISQTLCLLLR